MRLVPSGEPAPSSTALYLLQQTITSWIGWIAQSPTGTTRITGKGTKVKAKLNIGYTDYVLDVESAAKVFELLSKAEVYKSVYQRDAKDYAHYIYPQEVGMCAISSLAFLNEDIYHLGKAAGKPEE
jgi:hypothetical protein